MRRPRRVKILSGEELEQLPTARLLAYRRKLLTLEESAALGDWDRSEVDQLEAGYVYFKDSPDWVTMTAAAKAILDRRPNSGPSTSS